MVIGRATHGELSIVDRLREPVRLAAGLGPNRHLDDETVDRALGCLERFGQRIGEIPRSNVRAVGTQTLRRVRSSDHFLSRARRALNIPIEILSGAEEGRLIYLGVAHDVADDSGVRLVVDIGGGSTECVLGERFEAREIDSLRMGCVRFSMRFFPKGKITRDAFKAAETAARLELSSIQENYQNIGWDECVGSSGTIRAIAEITRLNGWSETGITLEAIRRLKKELVSAGTTKELASLGVQTDRAPVLPGGVAILKAVFQSFKIKQMGVSNAALREGLLWDLLGRIAHEDVRDRTIQALSNRYHIDQTHARRVARSALAFFDQVAAKWGLGAPDNRRFLDWGARLHEIGLAITHAGYHKHGEYLVRHSNMPGFSREGQMLLAALVRNHRRKVDLTTFAELPPFHSEVAPKLCTLLRVAVRLNRGRSREPLPTVKMRAADTKLRLTFPEGWIDEHPLTRADLDIETDALAQAGITLVVR